jgi:hypothetical protein
MVEWENGDTTKETLHIIAKDDPLKCIIYAKDNGLLGATDENISSPLPTNRRNLHTWSTKPDSGHTVLLQS